MDALGGISDGDRTSRYAPDARRQREIALCLSGGGYRAALFHLGSLRRLNEIGLLGRVETISGVSGGSILAAFLADRLRPWPRQGPVDDWEQRVAEPFRRFTRKNIRTLWFLRRLLRPWDSTVAVESLVKRYEDEITDMHLSKLPGQLEDGPRFVFSATDMAFGVNWVSERDRVGSYQAGYCPPPERWTVARAVAASSCFPPVFAPMPAEVEPATLTGGQAREGGRRDALIRGLRLTDGGVYDNMALEPVWKDHRVVLVSDGGATFDHRPDTGLRSTLSRIARYQGIQGRQASAIRKRWLISNFELGELQGAYWGIGSPVSNYDGSLPGYSEELVDDVISEVRTDLDHFSDAEAQVLQNHGYLLTDAALRTHSADWWHEELGPAQVPYKAWFGEGAEAKVGDALRDSHKRRLPFGRWKST